MNKEEQRIAIATKCGWKNIRQTEMLTGRKGQRGLMIISGVWGVSPSGEGEEIIPEYLNDLNAMHEAEKVLDVDIHCSDSPRYAYSREIYKLCDDNQQPFRASANVRAEAFCRTFWPEKFTKYP